MSHGRPWDGQKCDEELSPLFCFSLEAFTPLFSWLGFENIFSLSLENLSFLPIFLEIFLLFLFLNLKQCVWGDGNSFIPSAYLLTVSPLSWLNNAETGYPSGFSQCQWSHVMVLCAIMGLTSLITIWWCYSIKPINLLTTNILDRQKLDHHDPISFPIFYLGPDLAFNRNNLW